MYYNSIFRLLRGLCPKIQYIFNFYIKLASFICVLAALNANCYYAIHGTS